MISTKLFIQKCIRIYRNKYILGRCVKVKKVIVIGGGPAGLTITYQLLKSKDYEVKIIGKE